MSTTLAKKIVGMTSFVGGVIISVAQFATADNIAAIKNALPHNPTVNLALTILTLMGTLWGKHLMSSPSVADSVKEGTISQEVARVNASN